MSFPPFGRSVISLSLQQLSMAQEYAPQKVVMSEAVLIHIYLKYSVQNAH